jgi:hypothetical protein
MNKRLFCLMIFVEVFGTFWLVFVVEGVVGLFFVLVFYEGGEAVVNNLFVVVFLYGFLFLKILFIPNHYPFVTIGRAKFCLGLFFMPQFIGNIFGA